MPKFKVKFQLKDDNGLTKGGLIEETIEAPDTFVARDLINRKYGGVQLWGGPTQVYEPRVSSKVSSSSSQSQPNGCMVALGAVALVIAVATGALKPSNQPDAYQTPASSTATETPASPSAEQTPAPEPNETTEPAAAQQPWGAFAVSPSTSESAYATGYSSEDEAKQAALNSCGQSDCNILTTFGSGYATLAESDRNWFYSVGQSSDSDAINEAMSRCEERDPGHNCRVIRTVNF